MSDAHSLYRAGGKRLFDLCGAFLALVALWPVMAVAALAILIDDGRPVLFRQERCGRGARYFAIYKFRSMRMPRPGAATAAFEPGQASRVTRVGRILRRSKIDELPQLFNVLRGEMSLVGPRPEVRAWVEPFPDRWARALSVRPGITDDASISLRGEEEILRAAPDPQALYAKELLPLKWRRYDSYAESHGLFGDVTILARTVRVVVLGSRASPHPMSRNATARVSWPTEENRYRDRSKR